MRKFLPLTRLGAPLCLSLLAACTPTSETPDAGGGSTSSSSSSGAASSSSGAASSSSGESSSSNGGSTSSSSSGTASSSSGAASSSSSSSGTCPLPPFTLCDGINPDGVDRTVVTQGGGALGVDGLVTVGMTRAEVRAAFGADEERLIPGENGGASPLPFRVFYCEKRISVSYGDTADGSGNLAGTLSDDDVVNRVAFFDGFAGHTDTNIVLGDPRTEVSDAYGVLGRVEAGLEALDGRMDAYPADGVVFTHDGTNVTAIAVHAPYDGNATPTPLNPPLDLDQLKLGNITAGFLGGTSFGSAKTALGTPDVEGFATVEGQQIALLGYSNLGIRLVAYKSGEDIDSQSTLQAYLTPPFAGEDTATVIGIGATKAEFDAAYDDDGAVDFQGVTLQKYVVSGSGFTAKRIAVSFIQDETCTQRAALIVLNWVDAP
ncbi:MAG: hypothetical protein AB2A00_06295 [Myxococcota bacterium]